MISVFLPTKCIHMGALSFVNAEPEEVEEKEDEDDEMIPRRNPKRKLRRPKCDTNWCKSMKSGNLYFF